MWQTGRSGGRSRKREMTDDDLDSQADTCVRHGCDPPRLDRPTRMRPSATVLPKDVGSHIVRITMLHNNK